MPSVYFTFCTFGPEGPSRPPQSLVDDLQKREEDVLEVTETVVKALAEDPPESRLVLSIDDPNPVTVEFVSISETIGVAELRHADAGAVLVMAAGWGGHITNPVLQELRQTLAKWYASANMQEAFHWLAVSPLPSSVMVYLGTGAGDQALERVAMSVASAFFRVRRFRMDPDHSLDLKRPAGGE